MNNLRLLLLLLTVTALLVGCGASKDYVDQQIASSESRVNADLTKISDKTDANADEVAKLQSLASQLSDKTDMAINQAKGFEDYQTLWTGEINFTFDSYEINSEAEQILMECGNKMSEHPEALVEIAGHTDQTGTPRYNVMLGEMRAGAAKRFLSDRYGVSLYRMFDVSFGESKPIEMGDETQASQRNRRVTLTVWGRP